MWFILCLSLSLVVSPGGSGPPTCGSCGLTRNKPCPDDYTGIFCPPPCGRCGSTRDQPCTDTSVRYCYQDGQNLSGPGVSSCGECGPLRNLPCPPGYTGETCPLPCGRCGTTLDQPCEDGELFCGAAPPTVCPTGQYDSNTTCLNCTKIANCQNVNCNRAQVSKCSQCEAEFLLEPASVGRPSDECVTTIEIPCAPQTGCEFSSLDFKLTVPAEALSVIKRLTAQAVTNEQLISFANSMTEELQSAISLGPTGTAFNKEITVCLAAEWAQSGRRLTMLHSSDEGETWKDLTSLTYDTATGLVCGNAMSFSKFAAVSREIPVAAEEDSTSVLVGAIGGVLTLVIVAGIVQFACKSKSRVDEVDLEEEGEGGENYDPQEEAFTPEGETPDLQIEGGTSQ